LSEDRVSDERPRELPAARRLVHACFESLDLAKAMLDAEPGLLFARDGLGETALHYLAVEDQLAAVQFLFERGATLNTVSHVDGSPLSEAASLGYEALVEWLLANGALIDLPGQGEPTLLNAVGSGSARIVSLLLDAGANPSVSNNVGQTPLHAAATTDDRLPLTTLLLGAGADIGARCFDDTPLDVATAEGAVETAKLLRSHAGVA